jgi:hypothetical protein
VDGLDQTPYISSQQWDEALAAETKLHRLSEDGKRLIIDASHDGYLRQSAGVLHRRWLVLDKEEDGALVVVIWLTGMGEHSFVQSFHLHPDWQPEIDEYESGAWAAILRSRSPLVGTSDSVSSDIGGHLFWWKASGDQGSLRVEPEQGWQSKTYGSKEQIPVIRAKGCFTERLGLVTVSLPAGGEEWRVEKVHIDCLCHEAKVGLRNRFGARRLWMITDQTADTALLDFNQA